jgi:hypothetical protein
MNSISLQAIKMFPLTMNRNWSPKTSRSCPSPQKWSKKRKKSRLMLKILKSLLSQLNSGKWGKILWNKKDFKMFLLWQSISSQKIFSQKSKVWTSSMSMRVRVITLQYRPFISRTRLSVKRTRSLHLQRMMDLRPIEKDRDKFLSKKLIHFKKFLQTIQKNLNFKYLKKRMRDKKLKLNQILLFYPWWKDRETSLQWGSRTTTSRSISVLLRIYSKWCQII